jgi:Rrf2 family protein
MKISTKSRYGLRAMLELALNYGGAPVLMESISENQDISRKYLHAILTRLRTSGLVRSVRGTGGGFILSKKPAQIHLDEIIRALEGSIYLVDCVESKDICNRSDECVTRQVWEQVGLAIQQTLAGITLEDLVLRLKKIRERDVPMYFI